MKDQNCWIDEFEEEEASNSPDDSEEYFQPRRASQAVPNSRTSFANKRNSQIGNPAPHMQASELTLSEAEEGPKPSIDVPTRQPSTLGVPVDLRHANAKPHPNHPNHHPIRKMLRKRHQTPHVPLYPPKEFLEKAYTRGKIHDALLFKNGVGVAGVLGWKMMEYLPFRRMDLQPDGSWEAIIWPLPRGEVRDIPDNVKIHCSVLRRMEADPT